MKQDINEIVLKVEKIKALEAELDALERELREFIDGIRVTTDFTTSDGVRCTVFVTRCNVCSNVLHIRSE